MIQSVLLLALLGLSEDLGQRIYRTGQGQEPIQARLSTGLTVPGAVAACAGCHGEHGEGGTEGGGQRPSELRWDALSRPYVIRTESGRTHGPYDERSLMRAIREGVDPAGNPLHLGMPRFSLSEADGAALLAFLQRDLGHEPEPGVSEARVLLGALLPLTGPRAALGQAVQQALTAYLARINQQGGVYGRPLALVTRDAPEDPAARVAALQALLTEEQPFALVAPWTAGADEPIEALIESAGVPCIGPLSAAPSDRGAWTWSLMSPLRQQVQVLVDQAASQGGALTVLLAPDPALAPLAEVAAAQAARRGLALETRPLATGLPDAGGARQTVLLLGREGDLPPVQPKPGLTLLLLGPMVGALDALPAEVELIASYPAPPTAPGGALATELGLGPGYATQQNLALAALELTAVGLANAGRSLRRADLNAAMAGLREHETGLLPPVTFGPQDHLGLEGAWLLRRPPGQARWEDLGGWRAPR